MGVKLTESMSLVQQQALLDEVVLSAIKQGVIKDDELITRTEMIHHLVVCLGEAANPRKKIRMFKGGVIYPNGRFAFVEPVQKPDGSPNNNGGHIKTSVPQTPYTEGVDELSWFETINTIYIMAPDGKPLQDLRGDGLRKKDCPLGGFVEGQKAEGKVVTENEFKQDVAERGLDAVVQPGNIPDIRTIPED